MSRKGKYDIHKIRKQVKDKVGKHSDPTEFRPPKAEDGKPPVQFRFFVLPPIEEGDELATGNAEQTMEEFFLRNGSHYIDNKRLGCPRVINENNCEICQHGFDLMKETENKDQRRDIAKRLLPGTYMMVNIYFPNIDKNPEELRGQVRWYNCPKTVFDMWEDCLFRDDDGGDPQEPLPFGVFYDEEDAYLFRLEVVKVGQGNNYGKSKFFLTESFQSVPISGKAGAPDEKKIEEILAKRHNLFDKLPEAVPADIERVARNLTGGDDGGFDADETQDGKAEARKAEARKAEARTAEARTAEARKAEEAERRAKKTGIKPPVADSSKAKAKSTAAEPAAEPVAGEVPVDEPPFEAAAAETKESSSSVDDDDDVDALLDQLGDD